jgi:septum formation protein
MTPDGVGTGLQLVLASASPRRREILESLGISPLCLSPDLDESPLAGESPAAMVERLARAKAAAGLAAVTGSSGPMAQAACQDRGPVVVGADTTVVLGEACLGQPAGDGEAAAMLRRLSGRSHQVLTGVAVATRERCASAVDTTTVVFRELDAPEIDAYVATGEPRGKAGAYAIQGRAAMFVLRIEGSHHTVIGLPVAVLDQLCRQAAGRSLAAWAAPA